jgi:hypothetical protein
VPDSNRDQLAADNVYRAVATYAVPLRVALFQAALSEQARTLAFIRNALALAQVPRIELRQINRGNALAIELESADVVIVTDATALVPETLTPLAAFLAKGGLLFTIADNGSAIEKPLAWPATVARVLPGTPSEQRVLLAEPGHVMPAAGGTPVSLIPDDPLGGPLQAAQVFRTVALDLHPDAWVGATGGFRQPLLAARSIGAGLSVWLGTGLEPQTSTIGLADGFAKWLVSMLSHRAMLGDARAAYPVGSLIDARPRGDSTPSGNIVLEGPSGDGLELSAERAIFQPLEPGFHEIHGAHNFGTRPAHSNGYPLAVNMSAIESDLTAGAAEQLQNLYLTRSQGSANTPNSGSIASTAVVTPSDDSLWWGLMVLTLALLTLESFMAPPSRAVPREGTS